MEKKAKLFLTVESQLINAEGMMGTGNHHMMLANHNCCRQASPIDTNICESKCKKQNASIVSKYLPTRYLLFAKRKIVA